MVPAASRLYLPGIPSSLDPVSLIAVGFAVGVVVGLTGMGGGAVMTPLLVLVFRVPPLTAIGSDLVTSLFMKPVGGFVHWRRGTVEKGVVKFLLIGAVPSAFAGVFLIRLLGSGSGLELRVQLLLGAALLLAVLGIVGRCWRPATMETAAQVKPRPVATIAVGALTGLIVGMTSVGSGSLVIVLLMLIYPGLSGRRLVGTDLVQAIPMVGAAALGHVLYGDVKLALSGALLIGAIPGAYLGSRLSSMGPDVVLRPALTLVLYASALKLLGFDLLQPLPIAFGVLLATAVAYLTLVRPGHRRLTLIRLATGFTAHTRPGS